jgi:hypothetical protein
MSTVRIRGLVEPLIWRTSIDFSHDRMNSSDIVEVEAVIVRRIALEGPVHQGAKILP